MSERRGSLYLLLALAGAGAVAAIAAAPAHAQDAAEYTPEWAAQKNQTGQLWECLFNQAPDRQDPDVYTWCRDRADSLINTPPPEGVPVDRYTPEWAEGHGPNTVLRICHSFQLSGEDGWCGHYKSLPHEPPMTPAEFVDESGYNPDWTEGLDNDGATMMCIVNFGSDEPDWYDWDWCAEYTDHVNDYTIDPWYTDEYLSDIDWDWDWCAWHPDGSVDPRSADGRTCGGSDADGQDNKG